MLILQPHAMFVCPPQPLGDDLLFVVARKKRIVFAAECRGILCEVGRVLLPGLPPKTFAATVEIVRRVAPATRPQVVQRSLQSGIKINLEIAAPLPDSS